MSKGEQTRDFIYVDDLVDGIIKAPITKQAIGEIINLGSGKEYKIREVAIKIIDLMENPITPLIGALL